MSSIVIIPTYNEIENISDILKAVMELPIAFDILVVDDNSPDNTKTAVADIAKQHPGRIFLETRKEKSGLGTAYIHGFKWALEKQYDYIFEMDADFSHNPADLVRLQKALTQENTDMVVGSRYVTGVNVVNWPLSRVLLSYGASIYVKLITGLKIHDPTAGFVGYSKKVIQTIALDKIQFIGYAFQIEMKYKTYLHGFSIQEIPIIFTDRAKGTSKMSGKIINEAIFGVLSMRIKSLLRKKQYNKQ